MHVGKLFEFVCYGSLLLISQIIQGKKTTERKTQKKCATFSRTIELSYPNNNLDNKSMLVVPVIHSHTSLSVRIDMHMASNENLCPIYPNTLKTHHQTSFFSPFVFLLAVELF